MTAYYNEIDPYAAQWLRNLIEAGHIAPGVVDERSIEDVRPDEIAGYTQCHFFAGIGVWSYALRLAGWPDDEPVWTGSCPCQPFSAAGKGVGFADERHLWPAFHWHIEQCRPPVLFGEQVASKIVDDWLDVVSSDLEGLGFAVGAVAFPSAGVGAPHIRDRTYFMAHAEKRGRRKERAHARWFASGDRAQGIAAGFVDGCMRGRLADADSSGEHALLWNESEHPAENVRRSPVMRPLGHLAGGAPQHGGFRESDTEPAGPTNSFWRAADWLLCRDEKWRPVEPGTFPLAHGAPSRVVRTCTRCKTETVIYEGVQTLRKVGVWHEGLASSEVLQQRLLRAAQIGAALDEQEHRTLSGAGGGDGEALRTVRNIGADSRTSRGSECIERRARESGTPMLDLSPDRAQEINAFVNMRRVWHSVQSGIAPEQEQDMFCPVCDGVGSHMCAEEMGGSRVGRLRAYGNAINAQAAAEFIRVSMECLP